MSARYQAEADYQRRIQWNNSEAQEDRWDAHDIHGPELERAIREAERRYELGVRLECIRRARIRAGATCP